MANRLDLMVFFYNYCQRWRLSVNTAQTKVIVQMYLEKKRDFAKQSTFLFYNKIE